MWLLLTVTVMEWLFVFRCSSITFTIDCINKSGPSLPPEFLSVTIGVDTNEKDFFPFQSTELDTLAQGLAPAYMRFGGTSADQLLYSMNGNIQYESMTNVTYHINLTLFSDIANFAQRNNWKLIFGLNEQTRTSNSSWNSTNAKQLLEAIKQSHKQNNNNPYVYAFELGNEPNLYKSHQDIGYVIISPEQEAKDFDTLYQLIQTIFNSTDSQNAFVPKIWGNDGADRASRTYTEQWAQSLYAMKTTYEIDALTFHQYYGSSKKNFTLSDYYSVEILDSLIVVLQNITNISRKYFGVNSQIVFGETAASSGGGAPNITDTFVDGFTWLDKLGLSSIYGLDAVCRQIFYKNSNYALIRPNGKSNDLQITADYWSGYLFKNLVGDKVLYVNNEFEYGRYLRVYAFCTRTSENRSVFNYKYGSVTVMILNLYNSTQMFNMNFVGIGNDTKDMSYDGFYFTPKDGIINAADVLLNGEVVRMINETTFPTFKPVSSAFGTMLKISPLSYGFVVAVNVDALACN
eukprot:57432_1